MRNYLLTIWKSIDAHQRRRAAYWQLKHLSDKNLKDIGLTRGEIYYALYHGKG
jgi:uncharacterized protein YjiS (DUF1127 family)